MRSRVFFLALLATAGSFAVPLAAHAAIPFFGPIIEKAWLVPGTTTQCALGWTAVILVINNIISLLLTLAIVFVAPLTIAYAGFLYVVNPVNEHGMTEAKHMLWNTVFGLVIALAGWLIVDAIMAVLYHPSPDSKWSTTWASLVYGNASDICIDQKGVGGGLDQVTPGAGVTSGAVTPPGSPRPTVLSTAPGDPCNPATITAVDSRPAKATQTQANLLACVAQGESTCGTKNPPYNLNYSWNTLNAQGKASTAAGAYQVLLASNHECYEQAACYAAAGVAGPLNCQNAFESNGMVKLPEGALLDQCKKAAGNVQCSAAAAACLLNKQSFQSAYATDPYTASCLSKYGT